MNSENKTNKEAKKTGFYIAVLILGVAIVLSVALCIDATGKDSVPTVKNDGNEVIDGNIGSNDVEDITDDEPVVKPVMFIMPVEAGVVSGKYSAVPVYNETLNRYAAHQAVDFKAAAGTDVVAVYKGTIVDVSTSVTKGASIKIDHGNGLFTVYNSIEYDSELKVGATVEAGDVIGRVSDTNRQETADGAHLHFETIENGEYIDPAKYFSSESK